ncbi:hypothetical protein HPP92_003707 [Vanilla planifolia]|uniref:Potassium transporter n=1 Tax=Vanilla planifolia TaxID=51239 RepID=A0A835VJN7_VANPL|nr:hypothetical protein HPP92_003707 [Vanilla planifolia]
MLMILCVAVAVGFRDTKHMGNASGLAVITVMLVTTSLTSLVMILCWQKSPLLALSFFLIFGSIEALYFSASLIKFLEGAWLPILLAIFLMIIMYVWHYATIKKYEFDLHNKVSLNWLLGLGDKLGIVRVPGIGLVYTDLIFGIPANFSRFVTNLPAFHRILVFVCIKFVPVPYVPPAERYLVGRVGPANHRSYRCIVRYGYRDVHQDVDSFESELVARLADFVKLDASCCPRESSDSAEGECGLTVVGSNLLGLHSNLAIDDSIAPSSASVEFNERRVKFFLDDSSEELDRQVMEELEDLLTAQGGGLHLYLGIRM